MADDRIRRYVDDDDLVRAPAPFNHIVASPVFSPLWGRGWLGYTIVGDTIDLWFVHGDLSGSTLLDYTELMTFNDKQRSHLWMILKSASSYESPHSFLVFLLNPPQDGVFFPIPVTLKGLIDG